MFFIDLNQLKIIKEFHFNTVSREIVFDLEQSVIKQANELVEVFQSMIEKSPIAVNYEIIIKGEGTANEDEIYCFLSAVNAITTIFFANMILDGGRQREHRFDVPEKLLASKVSRSTLKRAVNQQTINDVFNLTIKYKDLIYILCDEKEGSHDN